MKYYATAQSRTKLKRTTNAVPMKYYRNTNDGELKLSDRKQNNGL
ncbi:hypothetical protein HMPREF9069_01738 [Atopobium sp. oral taxon 810 str. F0209]|nr:hypothetical protein HMPREF9069_01738 [Atopobium sp. oral taxon 810 str. F0209]